MPVITMSLTQNLLKLAKQGNPEAIAQLLNQALQPKGITARVIRNGEDLRVLLEASPVPEPQILVPYLEKKFAKLAMASIRTVRLQVKSPESAKVTWSRQLTLQPQPSASGVEPHTPPPPDAAGAIAAPGKLEARKTASNPPKSQKSASKTPQLVFGSLLALILMIVGASFQSLLRPARTTRTNVTLRTDAKGIYRTPIISRIAGIPVILVKFNDSLEFPMMVDTGASGTLITPMMASSLNLKPAGQVNVQTPSGYTTLDVGYLDSIAVDGVKVVNVPVAVGLPHMHVGLLGHDFFGDLDVTVREEVVEFSARN